MFLTASHYWITEKSITDRCLGEEESLVFTLPAKSRIVRIGLIGFTLVSLLLVSIAGTIRPTAAQGDTLLEDQFNDNTNSWELASKKNSKLTISDGTFSMQLGKENMAAWATPDMTFPDDISVQVETSTPEPSSDGDWNAAIIVRADSRTVDSAFYQFEVTGQGKWAFVTRTAKGEEYKVQKTGSLKNWDMSASNTLKVTTSGTSFTFEVNGTKLGTFEDDTINNDPETPKYVGLLATTFKGVSNVTVEFHNLTITGSGSSQEPSATPAKAQKTPTKKPTTKPKATPTEVAGGNGEALLDETFPDDNPNAWETGKGTDSNITIANNALTIEVTKKEWIRWTLPGALVKFPNDVDVTVTVSAVNPDVSGEWSYGLGVRDFLDNKDEFVYLFRVIGTGEWVFSKLDGSNGLVTLIKATALPKAANYKPKASNILRMTASGSHFEFYVNNTKVGEADDDSLTPPDESSIVLVAGTYSKASRIKAAFTEVVVKPASAQ